MREQIDPRDEWAYYRMRTTALRPGTTSRRSGRPITVLSRRAAGQTQSLRDLLVGAGQIRTERAASLARGICSSLDALHSQGFIHGNLHPENILVGADGRIEIVDIVPAKAIAYCSPEEARGRNSDRRSGLYAVGVMMYEMVTGDTPFQGSDPIAVLNDRLSNYPVPPQVKNPSVSPQFQEIIYRALERNPRNRYVTARDLALDLSNQQQVVVKKRVGLKNWRKRRSPTPAKLLDVLRALVPVGALALLFQFLAG